MRRIIQGLGRRLRSSFCLTLCPHRAGNLRHLDHLGIRLMKMPNSSQNPHNRWSSKSRRNQKRLSCLKRPSRSWHWSRPNNWNSPTSRKWVRNQFKLKIWETREWCWCLIPCVDARNFACWSWWRTRSAMRDSTNYWKWYRQHSSHSCKPKDSSVAPSVEHHIWSLTGHASDRPA